jgi:hypothetical protein
MRMIHPTTLQPKPSVLVSILAGLVATILLSALIFLAPALGFPFIDFARLMGGIFSGNDEVAFWLGFWLFFLPGVVIFPPILVSAWLKLPGPAIGFGGGLLRGLILGLALWLLSGLLLPFMAQLNQLPIENPGFFALGTGWLGAAGVLLGHLAYGIALGLTMTFHMGIEPLEAIGWPGYQKAYVPEISSHFEGGRAVEPPSGRGGD